MRTSLYQTSKLLHVRDIDGCLILVIFHCGCPRAEKADLPKRRGSGFLCTSECSASDRTSSADKKRVVVWKLTLSSLQQISCCRSSHRQRRRVVQSRPPSVLLSPCSFSKSQPDKAITRTRDRYIWNLGHDWRGKAAQMGNASQK